MKLSYKVLGIVGTSLVSTVALGSGAAALWTMGGHDLSNTRSQPAESQIGVGNASNLAPKWTFTTGGNVAATPAVSSTTVYFPDYAGNLFAVDRKTGASVWSAKIATATGITGDYARAAPLLAGGLVIIGNQGGRFATPSTPVAQGGAWLLAFNATTGALVWKTQIESFFSAIVTQGAVANGNTVYVGVSSNEEAVANKDLNNGVAYTCCSFRGSLVALDVSTGRVRWQTYTVPQGYSGGAIWGSTAAIDTGRNEVYVATGNNYSVPSSVSACVAAAVSAGTDPSGCASPKDHFDSIIALDLGSGAVKWSFGAQPTDTYNTDCGLPGAIPGDTNTPSNCPPNPGPDYDFAQGPLLFSVPCGNGQGGNGQGGNGQGGNGQGGNGQGGNGQGGNGQGGNGQGGNGQGGNGQGGNARDLVGAGEKAGIFWALDRSTGALVWKTQVGPGGFTGGMQWASATDGQRIYVAEANSNTLSGGYWSALDAATGSVLWSTNDPGPGWQSTYGVFGYSAEGPISVANGVVYACSLDPAGHMYGMNSATGQILWSYASGGSCAAGASIVDGTVFWGSGYQLFAPLTTNNNVFYAFSLGGK
jgi:polyvinyl alcohol dehydrogenase (cytochrome)